MPLDELIELLQRLVLGLLWKETSKELFIRNHETSSLRYKPELKTCFHVLLLWNHVVSQS